MGMIAVITELKGARKVDVCDGCHGPCSPGYRDSSDTFNVYFLWIGS